MIKLITYNVGNKSADQNRADELFNFVQLRKFDFVFVGLQEVSNDSSWTSLIKKCFGKHNYVMMKMRNIWGIWLYALVRRTRLSQIDDIESEITASGIGGVLGNKGGVSIRFKYQGFSIVVVNSHFAAHEEAFTDRLNDYLDIITGQQFRDPVVNSVLDHDFVFWMGDLNFRIEDFSKQEIVDHIAAKNYSLLVEKDQLKKAIKFHNLFSDFKEADLNFPPTFKFDDGTDTYDSSQKQRKPAWTDRILYMIHNDDSFSNESIELMKYYSEQNIRISDHRPVCAEFKISFNPIFPHFKLPIHFDHITTWKVGGDQKVFYRSLGSSVMEIDNVENSNNAISFKPDRWDWIGLVPSDWMILAEDTITYVYVTCTDEFELRQLTCVDFNRKYLTEIAHEAELQLIYFSRRKNCIQGLSNIFSYEMK